MSDSRQAEARRDSEARAQLLKPIVHFRTEIDSEYGPDSLRANFERLGEPARWNRVMSDRFGLRKEAKFYTLPSAIPDVSIRYMLEVFPYRNGSKGDLGADCRGPDLGEHRGCPGDPSFDAGSDSVDCARLKKLR